MPSKSILTVGLSLCLTVVFIVAPVSGGPPPETRVLLVGDSWAEFMWANRTLRDTFAANGRADIVEEGTVTAIGGTTAAEWADPSFLQSITTELMMFPTIDIVQLTLGGNDFLAGLSGGGWYVGISAQDFDALRASILADMTTVVDHILAHDPSMRVVISLYDYTNFVDSSICGSLWNDLGQPTPRQINDAMVAFQDTVEGLAASRSRVDLVDHSGLMQWTYGFPSEGIQPGDLLPPGDLDRPSPITSMFLLVDCIHLSPAGYGVLGENLWQQVYASHFNDTLFTDGFESGDLTGWSLSVP